MIGDKNRMALGGEPGMAVMPPAKPKGMHWKTYMRKVDRMDNYDALGDLVFTAWVPRRFPDTPLRDLLP